MHENRSDTYVKPPVEGPNIISNQEEYELQSQAAAIPLPDSDNDELDANNNKPRVVNILFQCLIELKCGKW